MRRAYRPPWTATKYGWGHIAEAGPRPSRERAYRPIPERDLVWGSAYRPRQETKTLHGGCYARARAWRSPMLQRASEATAPSVHRMPLPSYSSETKPPASRSLVSNVHCAREEAFVRALPGPMRAHCHDRPILSARLQIVAPYLPCTAVHCVRSPRPRPLQCRSLLRIVSRKTRSGACFRSRGPPRPGGSILMTAHASPLLSSIPRRLLLGLEVVKEDGTLLRLLAPVAHHDARAVDDLAGVAFAVDGAWLSSAGIRAHL